MNFTCRHVECPRPTVLSYENPVSLNPSLGTSFHSLQATSQALQPMHNVESVRKAVVGGMGPGGLGFKGSRVQGFRVPRFRILEVQEFSRFTVR